MTPLVRATGTTPGLTAKNSLIGSLNSNEPTVVLEALRVLNVLIRTDKKDINDKPLFTKLTSIADGTTSLTRAQSEALIVLTDNIDKIHGSNFQDLLDVAINNLSPPFGYEVIRESIALLDALYKKEFIKIGDEEVLAALVNLKTKDIGDLGTNVYETRQELISKLLGEPRSASGSAPML
jgi:hypothetical protein